MNICSKHIFLALFAFVAFSMLCSSEKIETFAPFTKGPVSDAMKKVEKTISKGLAPVAKPRSPVAKPRSPVAKSKSPAAVKPYVTDSISMPLNESNKIELASCGGNGQFISSSLLPNKENVDEGFDFSPANLEGMNFIDSSKFVIGTSSQSLKNANYQLRSEPPNPTKQVCGWNQSTIEQDTMRRPLSIGSSMNKSSKVNPRAAAPVPMAAGGPAPMSV